MRREIATCAESACGCIDRLADQLSSLAEASPLADPQLSTERRDADCVALPHDALQVGLDERTLLVWFLWIVQLREGSEIHSITARKKARPLQRATHPSSRSTGATSRSSKIVPISLQSLTLMSMSPGSTSIPRIASAALP